MNVKNFFLLLALLFVQGIFAKNPTEIFNFPRIVLVEDVDCSIPPPSTLNVVEVGPNWVRLSWPSVIGATQFRIDVEEDATGDAISTTMVPGNATTAVVSTAGASGSCHAKIWSVDAGGGYDYDNYTQSDSFDAIIIELVGSGFTAPPCMDILNNLNFPWDGTSTLFRIQTPTDRRFIKVWVKDLGAESHVHFQKDDNPSSQITLNGGTGEAPPTLKVEGANQALLGMLSVVYSPTSGGSLVFTPVDNTTTLKKVKEKPCLSGGSGGAMLNNNQELNEGDVSERDQTLVLQGEMSITPNPFHDVLMVQLPATHSQTGTTVHLYDLLGSIKQTYSTTADQTELTLNTADLTPGVYFLQVETEGMVQTVRVVKAK